MIGKCKVENIARACGRQARPAGSGKEPHVSQRKFGAGGTWATSSEQFRPGRTLRSSGQSRSRGGIDDGLGAESRRGGGFCARGMLHIYI